MEFYRIIQQPNIIIDMMAIRRFARVYYIGLHEQIAKQLLYLYTIETSEYIFNNVF